MTLVIIGLGNPEQKYENTPHNMGYNVVNALADKLSVKFGKISCKASIAEKSVNGEKIILAKPLTYMNLSGESVRELIGRYGSDGQYIVVYDDIDIPCGSLRARVSGSGGTHNGMRSVVACAGQDIPRIRVGIGRPEIPEMDLADYVLGQLSGDKKQVLVDACLRAATLLQQYIKGEHDFERLMTAINRSNNSPC